MNKIILTANPSFQTSMEADFWRQFERTAEGENWQVVKHSMRKIESDENTITLPARLKDVANFLGAPPIDQAFKLPEWMSHKTFYRLLEWEYKRWSLEAYEPLCEVGLKKLVWHVDGLFKELNPAIVIVSNKIDHGCALFDLAGRHYGSDVIFFERSASNTFFAEPFGMFGESVIWESFLGRDVTFDARWRLEGERVSERIFQNPDGFRPQYAGAAAAEKAFANVKKPIFFLPMDNTLWTGWAQADHPQKQNDYGENFPSPSEAINLIAEIANSLGGSLIVKRHPSDKETYQLKHDNTIVLDTPIGTALGYADVCIAFLTKVAFVSAAYSVPTVAIGHNPIAISGAVFHPKSVSEWKPAIVKALAASAAELETSLQNFKLFIGWLESEFFLTSGGSLNFAKPNAIDFALSAIRKNADRVSGGSFTSRESLRNVLKRLAERRWVRSSQPLRLAATTPIKVFFNVTAIIHESDPEHHCTATIFEELAKSPGIRLYPFVPTAAEITAETMSEISKLLGEEVWSEQALSELDFDGLVVNYSTSNAVAGDTLPKTAINIVTLHSHSDYEVRDGENQIHHIVVNSQSTVSSFHSKSNDAGVYIDCIYPGSSFDCSLNSKATVMPFLAKIGLTYYNYFVVDNMHEESEASENLLAAVSGLDDSNASKTSKIVFLGPKSTIKNEDSSNFDNAKAKRTVFAAQLSDAERSWLYSGASGFIVTNSTFTSALNVVDAMRCGCPIIAPSSRPEITEIVGDAGLYYDETSPKSLNLAMRTLISDNNIRTLLGGVAQQKSVLMTGANMSANLQDLFATIIRNVVFDPSEFKELVYADEAVRQPDLCTVWSVAGGELKPSPTLSVIGDQLMNVGVFTEDEDDRAHVILSEIKPEGNAFVASIIVKGLARRRFVFSISQHCTIEGAANEEKAKVEIFVDLVNCKVLRNRVASGDALILDSLVDELRDGWRKIDARFVWKDLGPQTVKIMFGAISDKKYTSKYTGECEDAFEIVTASLTASA